MSDTNSDTVQASERRVARRVLISLEMRRVFSEHGAREDGEACRKSANKIRHQVTIELMNSENGPELEKSLRRIRDASTAFVQAAGAKAANYQDIAYFSHCLSAYRDAVGSEVAWLSARYAIAVHGSLVELVDFIHRDRA